MGIKIVEVVTESQFFGSSVSSSEARALQTATRSELEQAQSLIFRGKQFAARGDPRLQRIINALSALGVQSPQIEQLKREARAREEAKAQAQLQPSGVIVPSTVTVQGKTFKTIPKEQLQDLPVQSPIPERRDVSFFGAVGEVLFGETGEKFVGVNILPQVIPFQEKDITAREIKTFVEEKGGLPGRVAGGFIPTTPGGVAIIGGLVGASFFLPPVAVAVVDVGFGVVGTKAALDPTLTTEERIQGGIVGGLGGAGFVFKAAPFVRGRFKPTAKVKVAEEGFEFFSIKDLDVGLIKPGGKTTDIIDLPPASPLRKGGFGRVPGGEQRFIGEAQPLTTSQIGLFGEGKVIPIEREFFVTPAEPFLKIPETRVSRLGLQDPFKFPKDAEFGFGLSGKPQIGILKEGKVTRKETAESFRIGTGTELEAIKSFGQIKDIKLLGQTRIKGQAVEVFEFGIGDKKLSGDILGKDSLGSLDFRPPTTRGRTRIQAESTLSKALSTSLKPFTFPKTTSKAPTTKAPTLKISDIISPPKSPTTSIISPPKSPTTSIISPPISPAISPPVSPPKFPGKSPPFFPSIKPPGKIRLDFGLEDFVGETIGKRKTKFTPSLGAAIRFQEFGIKRRRGARAGEISGLFERELSLGKIKKIELGSLIKEVKRTKRKKRKK